MSIDLSKLWPASEEFHEYLCRPSHQYGELRTSMRFVALARNAFDVMMRRGWWPEPIFGGSCGWGVFHATEVEAKTVRVPLHKDAYSEDPFTALVEADKWMCEQEKANAS